MRFLTTVAVIALVAPGIAQADTLGDALVAAYRNNPTLESARLDARAADEGAAQARAGYLPTLGVTGTYGERSSETRVPDGLGGTTTTNSDLDPRTVGVAASQDLYTGGRRNAVSRAARADVASSRENLRNVEQNVMLAAIAAYTDVLRDQEFVRIQQANLDVLAQRHEESRARFEVGEITLTDVAQAEARLAGAQAGLSQAQASLEGSRARYVQVIGQAPGELEAPPPAPHLPESLDEAVEEALELSPDVRNAKAGEDRARAQTRIERSALLPQLSVVGRWDQSEGSAGRDVETDSSSATAQLSIPLFEGGYARSRVRQSRIHQARAQAVSEETRRAVTAGVTAAWNDHLSADRVVFSSQEQARANALALEGVREEESVGLRTPLDVLNAQQEYLDSQLAVARAQRDAYVAAHALLQSIGVLDAGALGVNVPLYDPEQHARAVRRTICPHSRRIWTSEVVELTGMDRISPQT